MGLAGACPVLGRPSIPETDKRPCCYLLGEGRYLAERRVGGMQTCGDVGGRTKAGKSCEVQDGLDPMTGRCRFHRSPPQAKEKRHMTRRNAQWYQLEPADIRSFIGQGWRVYIKYGPTQIRGGGLDAA